MRSKLNLLFLCLAVVVIANAQQQPFNASLDLWKGGYFVRCCGLALASPDNWGIIEQPMQLAINRFVFKETDSVNIHSGHFSARLFTDTTSLDSAGDVSHNISVLVPGQIACAGIITYGPMGLAGDPAMSNAYSRGLPFTGNPQLFSFYMKINHLVPDTAIYAYVFTRWDSTTMKEDTIATNLQPIYDEDITMNEWTLFTDTIRYTLPGSPDTLHIIFRAGENGDPARVGNKVWLDDISFYYPSSGIVHLDKDDAVSIYPNPAKGQLNVKVDDYLTGQTLEIYDASGRLLKKNVIETPVFTINISHFESGNYLYKIGTNTETLSGQFSVQK